jgi:hypothetical protein
VRGKYSPIPLNMSDDDKTDKLLSHRRAMIILVHELFRVRLVDVPSTI